MLKLFTGLALVCSSLCAGQQWKTVRSDGPSATQVDMGSVKQGPGSAFSCSIRTTTHGKIDLLVDWRFRVNDRGLTECAVMRMKFLKNGRWNEMSINDPGNSIKWRPVVRGSMESQVLDFLR